MLDINLIREKPEMVKAAMADLNAEAPIDEILALDSRRRALLTEVEALRAERNAVSKEIGRSKDQAERQAKIAKAVNEFLNDDLLAAVSPEEQGRDVTMRQVLDVASKSIEGKFSDEPLVEASIRWTLGHTYESLGEYQQAELHLRRALGLRRTELGTEHDKTLRAMDSLASVLVDQGRYEEA